MNTDTRDQELAAIYRAGATEAPGAAADAAILRLAHDAVARKPGAGRRWQAPLALAATVLLAVGIVSRVQLEQPDLRPPSSPAPVSATAPAQPPAVAAATAIPSPATGAVEGALGVQVPAATREPAKARAATVASARSKAELPAAANHGTAASPETEASGPAIPSGAIVESARQEMARAAPSAAASDLPTLVQPAPKAMPAAPLAGAAASAAAPAPQPAADARRDAADCAMGYVPRAIARRTEQSAREESVASVAAAAPRDRRAMPANESPESAAEASLTPGQWALRIVALRKAGRQADADASLKRLMEKFPAYKLPAEARSAAGSTDPQ